VESLSTVNEQELLVTLANLKQKPITEITEITEGEQPMPTIQLDQPIQLDKIDSDATDINIDDLSKLNDISEYGDIGAITGEPTIDKENAEKLEKI
jgi:hypothetical protein